MSKKPWVHANDIRSRRTQVVSSVTGRFQSNRSQTVWAHLTMFLCFSSFRRQISLRAELGTPCKTNGTHVGLHRYTIRPWERLSTHLVVVVQPDPFQSHDFVGFSVFRLENCPVSTYERDTGNLRSSIDEWMHSNVGPLAIVHCQASVNVLQPGRKCLTHS